MHIIEKQRRERDGKRQHQVQTTTTHANSMPIPLESQSTPMGEISYDMPPTQSLVSSPGLQPGGSSSVNAILGGSLMAHGSPLASSDSLQRQQMANQGTSRSTRPYYTERNSGYEFVASQNAEKPSLGTAGRAAPAPEVVDTVASKPVVAVDKKAKKPKTEKKKWSLFSCFKSRD